jgi:acyl-CoA dehydrogenase
MVDTRLPFFDPVHDDIQRGLGLWAREHLNSDHDESRNAIDQVCRELVARMGADRWLMYAVPAEYGGALVKLDSRALCIVRETLAYHNGLADFVFAMQGLGSGAITMFGTPELKQRYLPAVASGDMIAAFALSEPHAGSDAAALTTRAEQDGDSWVLNGVKTWISNGGIADFYTVFARVGDGSGSAGISAFVVPASMPGLVVADRIDVIAPHPLATLRFENCRIPGDHLLGEVGKGMKIALSTLDVFRASVAAAACGFARRALDEAIAYAKRRQMFGGTLADLQLTQAKLADMAAAIDAAELLTYRAAWLRDVRNGHTTKEVAIAKMIATESAQQVIDAAVQIHGGFGVKRGEVVERLYREIRALRIYEGATEVQKLIIAREILKE